MVNRHLLIVGCLSAVEPEQLLVEQVQVEVRSVAVHDLEYYASQ